MSGRRPRSLTIVLILVSILISLRLGTYPLVDPDEGRNAAVSREMAASNDYVVPRLNGLPYLDKPIVYFAAAAAAMEVFGPSELAARLPALLFTFLTALLLFLFVRHVSNRERAYVAAVAFLTAPLTIAFARIVIFDSALTFCVTLATLAFYFAVEGETAPRWSPGAWRVIAWASIGLGILTKGPVALLLPLIVAVPYAIWRRRFGALWSFAGVAAFVLVIAPWLWAMQVAIGDFLQYAILTETLARVATPELQRTGPPWYFIPYLFGGALPWMFVLIFGRHRGTRPRRDRASVELFALLWLALPLIFFSISQSKRPQYILPLMVPVALLVAMQWDSAKWTRGARVAGVAFAVLGTILLVGPMLPVWQKLKPELAPSARIVAFALGSVLAVAGAVALFTRNRERSFAVLALAMAALPLAMAPLLGTIAEGRSAKRLIDGLRPQVTAGARLVGIEAFTGSMTFYLGAPIAVISRDGSEYTSNYVLRRYDRFAGRPGSTLQPLASLKGSLAACCTPRIFIVRDDDPHYEAALQKLGMRRIGASAHYHAWGPWTGRMR